MNQFKTYLVGIIIGALLTLGSGAFAESNSIPAVTNWIKFKFNDIGKELPEGYSVLNYEGRTYVPARFIAEELGANVEWDERSHTVLISKKETQKEIENDVKEQSVICDKGTNSEKENQKDEIDYEKLPISQTIDGVRLEIYSVGEEDEATKVYLKVKNTTDKNIQLNQESAYFQTNNSTYKHKDIKGNVLFWKDITWFTDIKEDEDTEGYVTLPPIPEDETEGKFYIEVIENNQLQTTTKYTFNLKW